MTRPSFRSLILGALAASALAVGACGESAPDPVTQPDSGTPIVPDAGHKIPDAGHDAGVDAGHDAGVDAGEEPDAGDLPDAGEEPDAGMDTDAGIVTGDCTAYPPKNLCTRTDSEEILFSAPPSVDSTSVVFELFRAKPDGSDTQQITPDGTVAPTDANSFGARSPDRQTIAFVSGRDKLASFGSPSRGLIYLANADGTNQRRLTTALASECLESLPQYSPDGQWIVFTRSCAHDPISTNTEFTFKIRPDGSNEERIMNPNRTGADARILFINFSHDSQRLYGTIDATVGLAESPYNVLVAYDMGSGQVTDIKNFGPAHQMLWGHPMELANGDILYLLVDSSGSGTAYRLESIHANGTGRTTVRNINLVPYNSGAEDIRFAINPAGTRVAYVHTVQHGTSSSTLATSLWVSDPDGTNAQQISQEYGTIFWMTWNL